MDFSLFFPLFLQLAQKQFFFFMHDARLCPEIAKSMTE